MTTAHQPATARPTTTFKQFVRLPLLGEAWVEREDDRPQGLPFFVCDLDREGEGPGAAGPVMGFTVRAGRWVVIVDRAAATQGYRPGWREAVWLATGGPLVALAGVTACLLAGAVRSVLATPATR